MIRDHKNTIYQMLSFIINTFQELPNITILLTSGLTKHISPEKYTTSKAKTKKIERQNLNRATFRFMTNLKRLCRRTIFFSKKDDMHFGFIKAYVWLKTPHSNSIHFETLPNFPLTILVLVL